MNAMQPHWGGSEFTFEDIGALPGGPSLGFAIPAFIDSGGVIVVSDLARPVRPRLILIDSDSRTDCGLLEELFGQPIADLVSSFPEPDGSSPRELPPIDVAISDAAARLVHVLGVRRWLHKPLREDLLDIDVLAAHFDVGNQDDARTLAQKHCDALLDFAADQRESPDTSTGLMRELGELLTATADALGADHPRREALRAAARQSLDIAATTRLESVALTSEATMRMENQQDPAARVASAGVRWDPVDRAMVPARVLALSEVPEVKSELRHGILDVSTPAFTTPHRSEPDADSLGVRLVHTATGKAVSWSELVFDSQSGQLRGALPLLDVPESEALTEDYIVDVYDAIAELPPRVSMFELWLRDCLATAQDAYGELQMAMSAIAGGAFDEAHRRLARASERIDTPQPAGLPESCLQDLSDIRRQITLVKDTLAQQGAASEQLRSGPLRPTLAELALQASRGTQASATAATSVAGSLGLLSTTTLLNGVALVTDLNQPESIVAVTTGELAVIAEQELRLAFVSGLRRWLHLPLDEAVMACDVARATADAGMTGQAFELFEANRQGLLSAGRQLVDGPETFEAATTELIAVLSTAVAVGAGTDEMLRLLDAARARSAFDSAFRWEDLLVAEVAYAYAGPATASRASSPELTRWFSIDRALVPARVVAFAQSGDVRADFTGDSVTVRVPAFGGTANRPSTSLRAGLVDRVGRRLTDCALELTDSGYEGRLDLAGSAAAEITVEVFDPLAAPPTDRDAGRTVDQQRLLAGAQDALALERAALASYVSGGTPREPINLLRRARNRLSSVCPDSGQAATRCQQRLAGLDADIQMITAGRQPNPIVRPTLAELAIPILFNRQVG